MNKLFAAVTAPLPHPDRIDVATRCFVRDLVLDALVGVYEHERARPQRIRITVDLDLHAPGISGEDLTNNIRALVGEGHVTLIETLAERIAERWLADARVRSVIVRVEKLDVFPDAASVGVEIERARA